MTYLKQSVILTLTICFAACSGSRNAVKSPIDFADNVVVAHRGAWKKKNFPQNSIASLREAINLGCTGSEFDVRMTLDDSLVINHDPEFHDLVIEKSTYSQLEAFSLANGEKFPTLQEYLLEGLKNNNKTRLVCEIKPSAQGKAKGEEVAEKVISLVKRLGAQPMTVFISFDYDMLKKLKAIDP